MGKLLSDKWGDMLPKRAEAACRQLSDQMTEQARQKGKLVGADDETKSLEHIKTDGK